MRKTKARELVRFGANVRKLREARDWTQEQLAERAELDQIGNATTPRPCSRWKIELNGMNSGSSVGPLRSDPEWPRAE